MRITPEILRKIARDTVAQRTRNNRNLLAVYLIGSLLRDEPLIGGTTDIDLVFVHNGDAPAEREIIRLTEDVHIDIAHHSRYIYHQPRELRLHPWMGPTLYDSKVLYDPQHFMDFTVASASAQFYQPENVLARANTQVEQARQIWLSYQLEASPAGPVEIGDYFKAVENAANAIASLSGPPLPERRLLSEYPQRATLAGRPGLQKGLLGLLGAGHAEPQAVRGWLPAWRSAIESIQSDQVPLRIHPHRISYYQRAFEYFLSSPEPMNLLWPLLLTWNLAISFHPEGSSHYGSWVEAMNHLQLLGAGFADRLNGLDAFVDTAEDVIEEWGRGHGLTP
jgi:hypothetical protein